MKRAIQFLLVLLILPASSGKLYSAQLPAFFSSIKADFSVFEENGKVGLKDPEGEVLIPARYDAIGWSDGTFSIINNVTGYMSNGLWGLINTQNDRLTPATYTDLSPGEGTLIVARKKIERSIYVKAGCINTAGKEVIPFQYDGIRISSFRAIVYVRNGAQFRYGLIDFENKQLIPLNYHNIYPLGSLRYGVENFDRKTAIFSENGEQFTGFIIDSISAFKKDYAIIYQNQHQGLIDRQGQIKLEPSLREVRINDDGTISTRQTDAWLWFDGAHKLIRQVNADTVELLNADLLKIQRAGKVQLTDFAFKPVTPQLFSSVGPLQDGKASFSDGGKKGVVAADGRIIINPIYRDLILDGSFIRAKQYTGKEQWIVLDAGGKVLTTKAYDHLSAYNGKFFPARHRGYWGAVNTQGKEIIACVHDSLVQQHNDLIVVKFKGKYGIISLNEDWLVTPQSNKLRIINQERYLEITAKTTFIKSLKGEIIYFSDNPLEIKSDHFLEHLPSGTVWKIDMNGLIVDRYVVPEGIEMVTPESEGLRAIKKDGRYGFVDSRGRLRIANRYEDVRAFSGTRAAARIRGKWGFISHEDNIAVQPVYDEVFPFLDGLAVVSQNGFYGAVDVNGRLILPLRYDSLVNTAGRIRVMQNKLWGLADTSGKMIIHPKFDRLDMLTNGYVIVSRNGKYGLLNHYGVSTIPEIYDALMFDAYRNQYIALKRAQWQEMRL